MSDRKVYYKDGFVALKAEDERDAKVWWVWRPGETLHGRIVLVSKRPKSGWVAQVFTANGPGKKMDLLETTPALFSSAAAYSSALTWIRKEWKAANA